MVRIFMDQTLYPLLDWSFKVWPNSRWLRYLSRSIWNCLEFFNHFQLWLNFCLLNCTTEFMFAFRLPHKTAFYQWKRLYYVNFCITALTRAKWKFHKQCLVPCMTLLHIDEKHHNNLYYVLWAFCENIQNIPNETGNVVSSEHSWYLQNRNTNCIWKVTIYSRVTLSTMIKLFLHLYILFSFCSRCNCLVFVP